MKRFQTTSASACAMLESQAYTFLLMLIYQKYAQKAAFLHHFSSASTSFENISAKGKRQPFDPPTYPPIPSHSTHAVRLSLPNSIDHSPPDVQNRTKLGPLSRVRVIDCVPASNSFWLRNAVPGFRPQSSPAKATINRASPQERGGIFRESKERQKENSTTLLRMLLSTFAGSRLMKDRPAKPSRASRPKGDCVLFCRFRSGRVCVYVRWLSAVSRHRRPLLFAGKRREGCRTGAVSVYRCLWKRGRVLVGIVARKLNSAAGNVKKLLAIGACLWKCEN